VVHSRGPEYACLHSSFKCGGIPASTPSLVSHIMFGWWQLDCVLIKGGIAAFLFAAMCCLTKFC
jgi:hypothetical protein